MDAVGEQMHVVMVSVPMYHIDRLAFRQPQRLQDVGHGVAHLSGGGVLAGRPA